MSEPVRTPRSGMEVWRPVSLGIGSSLSISKRKRTEKTLESAKPVSRSTTSLGTKSASSPRQKQRTGDKQRRSKSVMTSGVKLPPYSSTPDTVQPEENVAVNDSVSVVPSLPPAVLSKTTPTINCVTALRVSAVKREFPSPFLPFQPSDVNKQIKKFIEQLSGLSVTDSHNSFKPSGLKCSHQQGSLNTDNKYLAYVENLMRKRYFKALDTHFAADREDVESLSSDDNKEDLTDQQLPKLVNLNLNGTQNEGSSTAPNAAYPGADLLNYKGDNRKSSSETRNSSSPDDGNVNSLSNRIRRKDNRPSSRGKRKTSHPNGLIPLDKSGDVELPSVLDENITGTRLNPPSQNVKGGRTTGRLAVLKPLNSSEQLITSVQYAPTHRHTNPLSISGLTKPDTGTDEPNEAGWTHTQNAKVPTVTRPPVITSHQPNNNNSNSATSTSSHSTGPLKSETNGPLASLAVTATGSTTYSVPRRSNRQPANSQTNSGSGSKQPLRKTASSSSEADVKYADPIAGASPSFQARLSELAALEAETVRYERLRRLKKKNKERDD